jgi:tetratricopeptide (TPR) repeat protein
MSRLVRAVPAALVLAVALSAGARGTAGEDAAAKAYLAGELVKAQKLLETEIAAGGARTSRYLFLGRVYFRLRKWEKAQGILEALLEKDPEYPRGRELLGRVLFRRRKFKEALPCYEESLRQAPRAELRLELAEVLIGLGRKTNALLELRRVTEDSRTWPRAHYLLGSLRLESGLGHWAARQLWIAHRVGYRQKDLSLKLARAFYLEGRITGPLMQAGPFKDGKPGRRTEKHILVRRAKLIGESFWYAAAANSALYQVELALAGAKGPVPDEMLLLAARCWLTAGNLRQAGHYAALIRGKGKQVIALRADLALAGEDLEAFGRLLAAWPVKERGATEELVRRLVRAALVAQVRAELRKALSFLERAEELMPGRSEVLRPMIDVLTQLGRRKEASKKAQLLAELHPDSPEVRLIASRYGVNLEEVERRGSPVLEPKRKEER